jgi:integrase
MPALLATRRGKPDDKVIRQALNGWAFNKNRRETIPQPLEVREALRWLQANTRPVSVLAEPAEMRAVLDRLAQKLDGGRAAAPTVRRKRAVLFNAIEYAVELKLLEKNPIPGLKWKSPKPPKSIDKRVVVNPQQAVRLLDAVRQQTPSGPRLVAFFAVMYYSAARPSEAVNIRKQDLSLPETGWGELLLWESAPETGAAWSDTGQRRDRRALKHREKGDTRPVPCPPQLTALLHEHLSEFGTDAEGFLFRGVRETGQLSESTYSRAWRLARKQVLTAEEYASPLARRAYHLRHAAVSTWLNGGVAPTQIAEWAGHSVAVLLQIYAKCIAGQEEAARQRIEQALSGA